MRYVIPGKDVSVLVEFLEEGGEFVIPDTGSLKLSVRGMDGTPFPGYDEKPIPDYGTSTATLVIPASLNSKAPGLNFENRYVVVDYTCDQKPQTVSSIYRLADFQPITAKPSDVRAVFGARLNEIPDSDIDLLGTYFQLLYDYPSTFEGMLTYSPTSAELTNRAVVLKTALMLVSSMPMRILKQEALNNASQTRSRTDWVQFQADIDSAFQEIMDKLDLISTGVAASLPLNPLIVVTLPTDVITNS